MTNNKSSQNGFPAAVNKMSIEHLIKQVFKNWYLIVAAAILGLTLAFFYNQYFPKNYKASSVFLLKNQPHQLAMASTLEDLNVQERKPKVQNELAILSSYRLQLRTLQNLNWIVSWNTNGLFEKKDLYHDEPFLVTDAKPDSQQKEVPLIIKVVSDSVFTVSCDFHGASAAGSRDIEFSEPGILGRPFHNQYFHFTLKKIPGKTIPGSEYRLRFNDLRQMAIDYQSRLDVKTTVTESDVLTVDLKGTNAQRVVDYLNVLGTTYVQFGLEEKNRIASNKLNFIREQITGLSDSLTNSGNRFTSFRSQNKIVDLGQEGTQTLKKVEDVAQQENTLNARINYYRNLKKNLSGGDQLKNIVAPAEAGLTDPTINNLSLKLNDLISKREALSYIVQPQNPKMIAANKEIDFTQKLIAGNVDNLLNNAENELQKLEVQKQQVNAELSDIPKTERTLLGFKRDFDINSQLYNYLLQKSAEAAIALASNDPDVQILDTATIENIETVGFKSYVNLLIGLAIAMILSLAVLLLLEYNGTKLISIDYVTGALDLSVAGMIAHNGSSTEIPVLKQPYSQITESFRSLRATIQYLLQESNGKVIGIHSAIRGEGKSFVSTNLASILAISNKKVLLIEADFRSPKIFRTLNLANEKGLSDYLSKTASLREIEKKSGIPNLTFISAGINHPRLSEMLTSSQLDQLMAEAKTSYDYIIIDNAPSQLVSDSRFFASHSDINLFVLKMNYSSDSELDYINKTAKEEMIRNMIVVLNDVTESKRNGSQKSGYFNNEEYPQSVSALN